MRVSFAGGYRLCKWSCLRVWHNSHTLFVHAPPNATFPCHPRGFEEPCRIGIVSSTTRVSVDHRDGRSTLYDEDLGDLNDLNRRHVG